MTPKAPAGERFDDGFRDNAMLLVIRVLNLAAAGGFVHPAEFVFCGLPHEEEGQDVTGEDGGALPVPGGIGTGVRGRP